MNKSCVIVALILAIPISLGACLAVHDRPDSKLHLQDTGFLCLESNDMEKAIGIVKDILLEGIPRHAQLSEGCPAVEVFDKDLWPIYENTMDEKRTSYRLALDEDGGVIELFYRRENETEARFWPGFTIYVLSGCQREGIDTTYSQRVVVFIRDSDPHRIVEQVLRDEIEQ
ncbi:MAG: hypothetical protein QXO24_02680 [Candidatus Micrarchaeaceae archaeon]